MSGTVTNVHNERVRLRATLLNTMAGSCFTVGVFTPIAAAVLKVAAVEINSGRLIINAVFWLSAALVLHWRASRGLGRLT